jgi:hypothetical protein
MCFSPEDPVAVLSDLVLERVNQFVETKAKKKTMAQRFHKHRESILEMVEGLLLIEQLRNQPKALSVFRVMKREAQKLHLKNWYAEFLDLSTGSNA